MINTLNKLEKIRVPEILSVVLTLVPLAYLIYMAIAHSVNVPSYDEWYYIPMFEKMFLGTLTFSDLWAPVNEHRLLIPKLLMLLSVRFTHWNLYYLLALSIIVGVGIFLILIRFLYGEKKTFSHRYSIYILPLMSLLLFSLVQYENWLWGVQTLIFINELSVLVGFYYLTKGKVTYSTLTLASFAGFFASMSHLAGLLFWPLGFLILIFNQKIEWFEKKKFALAWLLLSILLFIVYFVDYFFALQEASSFPAITFQRLIEMLRLAMAILGSPLELSNKSLSSLFGFAGLVVFGILFFAAYKVRRITSFLLFLLAMALYGITSSLMTAIGRISYEPPFVASRYSSFPILFWVSFVILIFSLFTVKIDRASFLRTIGVFVLIFILLLSVSGSMQGTTRAGMRSKVMRQALVGFLSKPFPENMNRIATIYPRFKNDEGQYVVYLPHIMQKLDILSKYRLTFFNQI